MTEFYENNEFCGTEYYHTVSPFGLIATDGAIDTFKKFQCFWIADIIASYLPKLKRNEFYVCKFVLNADKSSGVFTIEDGNDNVIITQNVPFTDITVSLKLFLSNESPAIVLLPSEY